MKTNTLLIIIAMAFTSICVSCQTCPDFSALQKFYIELDGPNWKNNSGWDQVAAGATPIPCSSFTPMFGVTFDANDRVSEITMIENDLSGALPGNIGDLTKLTVLNLADSNETTGNNQITGSIPSTIGSLINLTYLNLSNNLITGSIPSSVGNLTNLATFRLHNNNMNGTIPTQIGNCTNLFEFSLAHNDFSADVPSTIVNCTNLDILSLTNYTDDAMSPRNIPSYFGNILNLRGLYIAHNEYTGTIPSTFNNLDSLGRLDLHNNNLTGSLPDYFSHCNRLQVLTLQSNMFSGMLPIVWGSLSNLAVLNFSNNANLTGPIPASYGGMTNMALFQGVDCDLTDSIPATLANWASVYSIQLQRNKLSGDIPDMFSTMTSLTGITLHENELTGPIPPSMGDHLNFLTLYNNNMSGCYHPNLINLCDTSYSIQVDAGNSFDTTWVSFCATGSGACKSGTTDFCDISNGLPTQIEVEGNVCVDGVINASEAFQLTPITAPPNEPAIGTVYYDGIDNKLKVWDGSFWRSCW